MTEQFKSQHGRTTVRDVAEAAGVSVGTVSAVINARGSVRDVTRRRVMEVIGRLNYELPRAVGTGGGRRRAKSIGLMVKEARNPFYADILLGVRAELAVVGQRARHLHAALGHPPHHQAAGAWGHLEHGDQKQRHGEGGGEQQIALEAGGFFFAGGVLMVFRQA